MAAVTDQTRNAIWQDLWDAERYVRYYGSLADSYRVRHRNMRFALLAAIRHQRRTGEGQLIDVSQFEAGVAAMAGPLFAYDTAGVEHLRAGNRVPFAAPHGAYRVRGDDRWLVLACLDDEQWRRLAAACGWPAPARSCSSRSSSRTGRAAGA